MKTTLMAMGICLVIGGYIGWSLKPNPNPIKPDTLIEYKYIEKTDTLIVPKFKTITKRDTIKYLDTIFVHNETQYVAQVDTTYEDSTLTASVQFISPIPLSPKSYFNMNFKVRERIITNTVVQVEEVGFFYKRFIPYIGVGMSYNGTTFEPALQIGFGIRIN